MSSPELSARSLSAQRRRLLGAVLASAALATWGVALLPADWPAAARGVVALLAAMVVAAVVGWLVMRQSRRTLQALHAGHRRFAALLQLAADAHFELDARGRVLHMAARQGAKGFVENSDGLGHTLWDQPQIQFSPAVLEQLRSAIEHRQPWRDLPLTWSDAPGRSRQFTLSGEPRAAADGSYLGHWGVLRDVSLQAQAQRALEKTETRFHDLFRRMPTPLVLHRGGRVLDANPAAVLLFGHPDLRSMIGSDVLESYEPGDSRERARARLLLAENQPLGHALPPAEYRLIPPHGSPMVVQVSSVRIEDDAGTATLSIYNDLTERRETEEAVLRSEALLSHLVSTSPDAISLTEMETGRYAMVNPSFERITGYAAHEVLGRTADHLNIWMQTGDRDQLVDQVLELGTVQNHMLSIRHRDGHPVAVLLSAACFAMDGRDYLMISGRDVSAAEQARMEHEAILHNALIGVALTREQHFMMVNPRFEEMLGWPRGLLVGQPGRLVWPSEADYRAAGERISAKLARGEQVEIEQMLRRRDGSQFLCRILAKAVDPSHPSRGGTIWLAEDITERRQVEQALAKARDEAEAASRAKSAFLANTSHEIRTPLNALLGLARLARSPDVDERRRRQYIDQISESAETLSGVLSDILDLSKIEAGKMHLDHVAFDLRALLGSLYQAYGTLADTKGLMLSMELDADLPGVVMGDPVRVRQILSNYLGNAVKFTDSGRVRLSARRVGDRHLRFEVTDTGPGIDEEVQAMLFRPFVQADSSTTRRVGGTGLGLSICRQLADLMGGRVGVASMRGQGSCFWAELPLPEGDREELDSGASGFGMDPVQGARVLMVEDNAVNMMIAVALLEQWGAQVAQASDGAEAIEAIDRAAHAGRPFDLVLMDVQMPGMSGHQATALLRRRYTREELPIIALTAAALVSERDQALAAGMNDFLTKPIDSQRLRSTLARALRREETPDGAAS